MRLRVFLVGLATLVAPLAAQAQGYSVVGGGSTTADAPPTRPAPNPGTVDTTASPNGTATVAPAGTATITPARGGTASPRGNQSVRVSGSDDGTHQPADYAGLTPGAPDARIPGLSRREQRRAAGRPIVAWPGFQLTPNGSRVFVATTQPVVLSEGPHTPGRWTYTLSNAYIPLANNRRALVTSAFETPVDRVSVHQRGRDADVVIEMHGDTPPRISQGAMNPRGLYFIFFDFPRWTPPNHIPGVVRNSPNGPRGDQGVRLSPTQPATDVSPADGTDDERPPPVQR